MTGPALAPVLIVSGTGTEVGKTVVTAAIAALAAVTGVGTSSNNTFVKDLPLFIAFLVLAIFTFVSGLRAPAAISFIKDTLVYVMVIVAVFYIPTRLGGWGHIFGTAQTHFTAINPVTKKPNGTFIPTSKATGSTQLDFATLALGSAVALFLYPHTITGSLASKRRYVVKRNTALLPIYSILLGLIALLGYMAITDKTTVANVKKAGDNAQLAVPYLFQHMFSSWFAGVAFAAIIIGALVPAAIMAIAAANLFTRNIFTEYFKPDASPRLQTRVAQWASLVVKLGALYFAVELPHTFAINLLAARRRVDPAAGADAHRRPVHPLVRPLRSAARLAGRHAVRHDRGLQVGLPDRVALGVVVRHRARAHGLHRPQRGDHQPDHRGDPDRDLPGREGAAGRRRDPAAPVHRRPRRPAGPDARGHRPWRRGSGREFSLTSRCEH